MIDTCFNFIVNGSFDNTIKKESIFILHNLLNKDLIIHKLFQCSNVVVSLIYFLSISDDDYLSLAIVRLLRNLVIFSNDTKKLLHEHNILNILNASMVYH